MRPRGDVERVAAALASGMCAAEAARVTGIPWRTVRKWELKGIDDVLRRRQQELCGTSSGCRANLPPAAYLYLLGLYLGDGFLARNGRNALRLEIVLDDRYPRIIAEAAVAIRACLSLNVQLKPKTGCTAVCATSVHWRCLFPQHGPGRKHLRPIRLEPWQMAMAQRQPAPLLRGLVHSDGCRSMNRVAGHEYPRYFFSNRSDDIRSIFTWTCGLLGVEWRTAGRWNISVARRESVARLDALIGPKA